MLFPIPIFLPSVDSESWSTQDLNREKAREIRERRERRIQRELDREIAADRAKRADEAAARKVIDDARIARWLAACEAIPPTNDAPTLE